MPSPVRLITSRLLDHCVPYIQEADTVYLLISFVMESGTRLLLPYLREAVGRGADVKILTGDYLFVTQPEALLTLLEVGSELEMRLWQSQGRAFHPKAYLFRTENGEDAIVVGSSNASRSALTTGVEWSLSVASSNEEDIIEEGVIKEDVINEAEDQFLHLFYSDQTMPVNPETIRVYEQRYHAFHQANPNLAKTWSDAESEDHKLEQEGSEDDEKVYDGPIAYSSPITLRPAQEEALYQLETTRAEGYNKALVVMATGLGKTYLAALFASGRDNSGFNFNRVLFIAHREEILLQAQEAFQRVLPDKSTGLYTGQQKDSDADILFASIFTLAKKRHRTQFQSDHFDLIIIDEFHHAAAATYKATMEWFEPKFLLGLTATPDRADGREVYALCDRNVAYRMEFLEAIERKWLAPFHYVGVYDETDYSQIHWLGTKYDEEELLAAQTKDSMADLVFDAWNKNRQTRCLAFCSSVAQASFLTDFFRSSGVRSVCLHGGSPHGSRRRTIQQMTNGELDIIFTVDLFNEGVDIPAIDTLLFVRPTESLTVFTQQIGRGLRIHEGKTHCTIIDLIGNYRNADIKLTLLDMQEKAATTSRTIPIDPQLPDGCRFDLDLRVIDLIKEMRKKKHPRKDLLREAYFDLKLELGHRPSYEEMRLYASVESTAIKQEYGSFVNFLISLGELSDHELEALQSTKAWFTELESTRMTKGYKMVVLLAMLERGPKDWHKSISAVEIATFFRDYYLQKEYRRMTDFPKGQKTYNIDMATDVQTARLIENNPMAQWAKSTNGIAKFDKKKFWFELDVKEGTETVIFDRTKEACLYRLNQYFERKGQKKGH